MKNILSAEKIYNMSCKLDKLKCDFDKFINTYIPQVNVDWNANSGITQILNKPNLNYTLDEVLTGEKWVNNKPIYRKVLTKLGEHFDVNISHNIPNIDIVIKANLLTSHEHGQNRRQTYTIAANAGAIGDSCVTNTEIEIENPNGIPFIDNYYILEYTKNTD